MCKLGNRSIYRKCREAILRQVGSNHLSNQELRRILAENDGCMYARLDKPLEVVLKS